MHHTDIVAGSKTLSTCSACSAAGKLARLNECESNVCILTMTGYMHCTHNYGLTCVVAQAASSKAAFTLVHPRCHASLAQQIITLVTESHTQRAVAL